MSDKLKILFIFNKLSDFKNEIYQGFIEVIEDKAVVDLFIHQLNHHNPEYFESAIKQKTPDYDFIVLMLHTNRINEDIIRVINKIPKEKLILLDKKNELIRGTYACVFQDFENDILTALHKLKNQLRKYSTITLLIPDNYTYAINIAEGLKHFGESSGHIIKIGHKINEETVQKGEVYLIVSEIFLAETIRLCQEKNFTIGKEVGIISYNETPIKEVLLGGITVVTTDHAQLGRTAANLILAGQRTHVHNPFLVIERQSV
jgi:DNA-binding LacI/PurR family transcriptional regulator